VRREGNSLLVLFTVFCDAVKRKRSIESVNTGGINVHEIKKIVSHESETAVGRRRLQRVVFIKTKRGDMGE